MDADVQRRQALGDHPLEVGLGEAGERGEVPVQEAQPVVVVLQVQAAAQALGQLVDEAELAVVVARAHPVEQRARHLGAERLAGPLVDVDVEVDARCGAISSSTSARRTTSRHSMTSRGTRPLTRATASPGGSPARSAGEPGATATTRGADMAAPGYRWPPRVRLWTTASRLPHGRDR